jgi:hypothetical protein
MSGTSIPQNALKQKKLMELLKGAADVYGEETSQLVYYCYEEFGATYEQIGKAFAISTQAVAKRWPKGKHGK